MTRRSKLPTVQELAEHVRQIAEAFKIMLIENPQAKIEHGAAVFWGPLRLVHISPVVDEATYAAALHELGHCLAPLGQLGREVVDRPELRLVQEQAAWEWAQHYALDWTPTMEHIRIQAFATYEKAQVQRQRDAQKRDVALQSFLKKVLK